MIVKLFIHYCQPIALMSISIVSVNRLAFRSHSFLYRSFSLPFVRLVDWLVVLFLQINKWVLWYVKSITIPGNEMSKVWIIQHIKVITSHTRDVLPIWALITVPWIKGWMWINYKMNISIRVINYANIAFINLQLYTFPAEAHFVCVYTRIVHEKAFFFIICLFDNRQQFIHVAPKIVP